MATEELYDIETDKASGGWIKLHRKLLDWEWYSDIPTARLFIHLLLLANHAPKQWRGRTIQRGQVVSGIYSLSKSSGLSQQEIRTALKKLKSTNEITSTATNKYSVITIVNYNTYQLKEEPSNKQTNKQRNKRATNEQQTNNKQSTTNKNDKKNKNNKNSSSSDKPELLTLGSNKWFRCTQADIDAALAEFGQEWLDYWIAKYCAWAEGKHPAQLVRTKNCVEKVKAWHNENVTTKGLEFLAYGTQTGYYTQQRAMDIGKSMEVKYSIFPKNHPLLNGGKSDA